jgi:hypothetical protein
VASPTLLAIFKPSETMINAWVVTQQRMSGLACLGDPRGPERKGQSRVVADLRSV